MLQPDDEPDDPEPDPPEPLLEPPSAPGGTTHLPDVTSQ